MRATAAVLYGPHQDLVVEEVDLQGPRAHEVLVEVVGSGICGSDLHGIEGDLRQYGFPLVLGHEVSGVVAGVGPDVATVAEGDHVLVNLMPGCGYCAPCCVGNPYRCLQTKPGLMLDGTTRMSLRGRPIYQMASIGGFADRIVVGERSCVPIRPDAPLEQMCLVSCGVVTGWSAVFHAARVPPGATAAVVGCGGVGLNVVQCLSLAHASRIVAVDVSASKLELARQFGATDVVDASAGDPVAQLLELTGGRGVDASFEVISRAATIRQAFDATRPGGTVTVVGIAAADDELTLPANLGRTVLTAGWRQVLAWRDFPILVDLYMNGKLKVDQLVSRTRELADINAGFADLRHGRVARTVLLPHG